MKHKTLKTLWTLVAIIGIGALLLTTLLPAFY